MTAPARSPNGITSFKGLVLRAGDHGYDEARRVFNGMVDRSPALIAQCTDTSDVVAALEAANGLHMPVSVYGGGHGVTGSAVVQGGLCIDLRGLNSVEVDPGGRTVTVGGGCTWGAVDTATQRYALAVTGGRVPSTGVGGLVLGSGSGWIERAFGLTCDSLLEAEMVAADGLVVRASTEENPDLFWGLRGGGGNFGIVTELTLGLHDVGPMLLAGIRMYPAKAAGEVLRRFRDFLGSAPDEVGGGIAFLTAPPLDFVPEFVRGQPVVAMVVCYVGSVHDGRRELAPLLDFGEPVADAVRPMSYLELQQLTEASTPPGMQNYWTADFLGELPDAAVDTLVDMATRPVSRLSQVHVLPGGGAIARVPDDATAFGQRSASWNVHYLSMWADPTDGQRNIDHTRRMAAAMKPWTTGRAYLNFIGDEGQARVAEAFGPAAYARLQALKRQWDPQNVFRHNQNIPPVA
ncbi:MAG: FAD-binding oxidoreductase [Nocardioidaceae bacterium]